MRITIIKYENYGTLDKKSQYSPYLNMQELIKPYLNCKNY